MGQFTYKLKSLITKLGSRIGSVGRVPVGIFQNGICVDYFEVEPYGVFRICGWSYDENLSSSDFSVVQNDKPVAPTILYRTACPNIAQRLHRQDVFCGFSAEWIKALSAEPFRFSVRGAVTQVQAWHAELLDDFSPHYENLLLTEQVLHREDIYGSGPPVDFVNRDVLNLALTLKPPILDFGCGSGALVRELRTRGVEAYGIELNREIIKNSLDKEAAQHITLYDGRLPTALPDGAFESLIASEVIEHIVDYEAALREMARLTRSTLAITVPDMTCIPIGSRHNVVPWHLLEATHVNFFNYNSLRSTLSQYFKDVDLFKIVPGQVNGSHMPGSLAAICYK
jgi:2-polyprenyl-3-methyl-5-hydroxy-6-metoxy-1,4-benzoquinol methylase